MTVQPFAAGKNDYALNSNLRMFTPIDATGGRGISRSSVVFAVVVNVALIGVLSIQVHHRLVAERPRDVTLVAPVEKLPEPAPPRFVPRVMPPTTVMVQPDAPVVLHRAAEMVPVPADVGRVLPREAAAIPMTAPTPRVIPVAAAPTVRAVALTTNPATIQPSGPSVANVNLTRSASSRLGGAPGGGPGGGPGVTAVSLGGLHGLGGGSSVAPAGAVHLPGCAACQPGDSGRNAIPKPIEPRSIARIEPSETRPTVPVAETPAVRSVPTVLFKPRPADTAEATALRIEGSVKVRIRVSSSGAVTVLSIPSGLGHGLDESAMQCAQGIRFKPALDAAGQPVAWEGVVTITFQMS